MSNGHPDGGVCLLNSMRGKDGGDTSSEDQVDALGQSLAMKLTFGAP